MKPGDIVEYSGHPCEILAVHDGDAWIRMEGSNGRGFLRDATDLKPVGFRVGETYRSAAALIDVTVRAVVDGHAVGTWTNENGALYSVMIRPENRAKWTKI